MQLLYFPPQIELRSGTVVTMRRLKPAGVGNKSQSVCVRYISYLAHFGEVNNRGIAKHSSSASWVKRGDPFFSSACEKSRKLHCRL